MEEKLTDMTLKELQDYFRTEELSTLYKLKSEMDDRYHNTGDAIIGDWGYDLLVNTLKERNPSYVPPVGAKIREAENRVKLPFWLGSADKITPTDQKELVRWVMVNPSGSFVVSDKLDGVSCLLVCKDGRVKLYTRGDGTIGADISYLTKYFGTIPDLTGKTINVRGELI